MRVRFYSFLLAVSLCGCATIQDYHYCLVQKHRADAAWKACYGLVGHHCSRDYADGWKQGYFDVSTGQCEEPPAVPPHKYWNASYQSLEGKAAIEEWYSGWQDGATAAVQDGNPYFHAIPASPTAPQGPTGPTGAYGPHMFQGAPGDMGLESGSEKLPPSPPSHELQPQVYVAPVPNNFQNPDEEQLLDETSLEGTEETSVEAESSFQEASMEYPTTDSASYEEGTEGYYAPASAEQDELIDEESAE